MVHVVELNEPALSDVNITVLLAKNPLVSVTVTVVGLPTTTDGAETWILGVAFETVKMLVLDPPWLFESPEYVAVMDTCAATDGI